MKHIHTFESFLTESAVNEEASIESLVSADLPKMLSSTLGDNWSVVSANKTVNPGNSTKYDFKVVGRKSGELTVNYTYRGNVEYVTFVAGDNGEMVYAEEKKLRGSESPSFIRSDDFLSLLKTSIDKGAKDIKKLFA